MPRKKPTRKDKRYEYKLTIGRDIHGKLRRKSFYSTISLADAKKKAEEYRVASEVSARTGEAFVPSTGRFADWARKWLKTYKQPFVDVDTYKLTYVSLVEGHLIPYFGNALLSEIRPADVQAYFATKTACSESRLKKMRSILKAIFESAIENDLCYKDPAKHSTYRSTAQKHIKHVLSDEQMETVKAYAVDRMPEVVLLLETGLRRGELVGLMWSDIDMDEKTLRVRRSMVLRDKVVTANPPKWNSYRTLPLSDEAMALIRTLPHDSLYVFPNENGAPHCPNSWSQKLKRLMRKLHAEHIEIPVVTAHELRHTYGTYLRRHGADIYTIQKLLGHKDINVTAEIYVHNELDTLRNVLTSIAPAAEDTDDKLTTTGA